MIIKTYLESIQENESKAYIFATLKRFSSYFKIANRSFR